MLGHPHCGSKVREALDRAIGESGKDCGQVGWFWARATPPTRENSIRRAMCCLIGAPQRQSWATSSRDANPTL